VARRSTTAFGSLRTIAGAAGFPRADTSGDPILPESGHGIGNDRISANPFLPLCE
jgi:hypothetical protein